MPFVDSPNRVQKTSELGFWDRWGEIGQMLLILPNQSNLFSAFCSSPEFSKKFLIFYATFSGQLQGKPCEDVDDYARCGHYARTEHRSIVDPRPRGR